MAMTDPMSRADPMAMADLMGGEPMAEPEAEPGLANSSMSTITDLMGDLMAEPEAEPIMANSSMSAEELAAMAPMEDLLPTLLQIFLTVRL